jgi:thiamine biosynthesis protein ThiS
MKLWINGDELEAPDGCTVAELLELVEVPRERVAVEVNLRVVRRADHHAHRLASGDKVEVVQLVGGG